MTLDILDLPEDLYSEYNRATVALEKYVSDYDLVQSILLRMGDEGVSRSMMIALEAIDPELVDPNYPVVSYTEEPSAINLEVALEGLITSTFKGLWSVAENIIGAMIKVLEWVLDGIKRLFGIGSSSGGGSSGSGSSGSSKPKKRVFKEPKDVQPMEVDKTPEPTKETKDKVTSKYDAEMEEIKVQVKNLAIEFNNLITSPKTYGKLREYRTKTIVKTNFSAGLQSILTMASDVEKVLKVAKNDLKLIEKNLLTGEQSSKDLDKAAGEVFEKSGTFLSLDNRSGIANFFRVYNVDYPKTFASISDDYKITVNSFIQRTRGVFDEINEVSKQLASERDKPKENDWQWWSNQVSEDKIFDPEDVLKEVVDLYGLVKDQLTDLRSEFKKAKGKPAKLKISTKDDEPVGQLGTVKAYREILNLSVRSIDAQIGGVNKLLISAGRWYSQWRRYNKEQLRLFEMFNSRALKKEELQARFDELYYLSKQEQTEVPIESVTMGTVVDGKDVVISKESLYDPTHRLGKYYS
jgi:hypothetical protein